MGDGQLISLDEKSDLTPVTYKQVINNETMRKNIYLHTQYEGDALIKVKKPQNSNTMHKDYKL